MQRSRLEEVRKLISINNQTLTTLDKYIVAGNAVMSKAQTKLNAATHQDDIEALTVDYNYMEGEMNILRNESASLGLKQVGVRSEKCLIKMFLKEKCGGLDAVEPPFTGDVSDL